MNKYYVLQYLAPAFQDTWFPVSVDGRVLVVVVEQDIELDAILDSYIADNAGAENMELRWHFLETKVLTSSVSVTIAPTSTPTPTQMVRFVDYVYDFYGPDGIYPMNATKEQIREAVEIYLKERSEIEMDSVDREAVRDILIEDFKLVFPEN